MPVLQPKDNGKIRTICFVSKEEYKNTLTYEKNDDYFTDVFIDYIIWPEELLTQEIFRIVTVAHALVLKTSQMAKQGFWSTKSAKTMPL